MRNPTYLELSRNRIFYFRWPIAQPPGGSSNKRVSIKVSLGTRVGSEALYLARHLSYVAQTLMKRCPTAIMRYDEIRAVLTRHFQDALKRQREQMAANGRLKPEAVTALSNGVSFADEAIFAVSDLIPGESDDALAGRFAEMHKLELDPGSDAFASLKSEMKKAYRAYCAAVLAQDQSFQTYHFDREALQLGSDTTKSVTSSNGTLGEVAARFMVEEKRAERWVARSEQQKRQHIELLAEILGSNTQISEIGPSDAQRVKEILLNYPRNRNKSDATRKLSIEQISQPHSFASLTVRTINTYLQTYSGLFSWAKKNRYVAENLFEGASVRENKKSAEAAQRTAFSQTQIDRILNELLTNQSGLLNRDYQKWGPLIGLYTGARLNEICQLTVEDIREIEGVWCFDFNEDGEGKSLKTVASQRVVPVHDQLIRLGLLERLEKLRSSGQTRLFPELSFSSKEGYGRALSRWFNDQFLVKLGIKSKDLVFHSFRHGMVTKLMQAGVEENLVKAIVGHTRQGVTQQHYFKQGYTLTQMQNALKLF